MYCFLMAVPPVLHVLQDTADQPEPGVGWSAARASALGAAMLGAVLEVAPRLR